MRIRARIGVLIVFSVCIAVVASAQLYGVGGMTRIADVQKKAETGEYFAIEGDVSNSRNGRFFTVRDDSGEMIILIPQYITRDVGVPQQNERIRVSGKYDRKKLDHSVEGMRVARLERLGKQSGARGKAVENTPSTTSSPRAAAPPAAQAGEASSPVSILPVASADLKEQLRAKRIAHDAARAEVEDAAGAYAKALFQAGDSDSVDDAIQTRLMKAEAHRNQINSEILPLIEEARRAGVAPEIIKIYEDMTIGRF
jgi:uncharacterized protein YdeI (BOF family)